MEVGGKMRDRGLSCYHCLPSTYQDVFPLTAAQSEIKVLALKYLKDNFFFYKILCS